MFSFENRRWLITKLSQSIWTTAACTQFGCVRPPPGDLAITNMLPECGLLAERVEKLNCLLNGEAARKHHQRTRHSRPDRKSATGSPSKSRVAPFRELSYWWLDRRVMQRALTSNLALQTHKVQQTVTRIFFALSMICENSRRVFNNAQRVQNIPPHT